MPDEHGKLRGISVPAAAWDRIFGCPDPPDPKTFSKVVVAHPNQRKQAELYGLPVVIRLDCPRDAIYVVAEGALLPWLTQPEKT